MGASIWAYGHSGGISFCDGLIFVVAESLGEEVVHSEDFNAGQVYEKVRVVNPLRD